MKIINLFGSPGTGKSTTAAGLFYLMKCADMEVELVTEYAKYLVWAERANMFEDQMYIFAKQNHKLSILKDKVDYAISDSPLLLSNLYGSDNTKYSFMQHVHDVFNSYDNINIFLNRTKKYNPNGRNQTEEESDELSIKLKKYLIRHNFSFIELSGDKLVPGTIYKHLTNENHEIIPRIVSSISSIVQDDKI